MARIHAKNCHIKDFVKVLGVSLCFMEYMDILLILSLQAFRKLSRGMEKLADESESFKSKTILACFVELQIRSLTSVKMTATDILRYLLSMYIIQCIVKSEMYLKFLWLPSWYYKTISVEPTY